MMTCAFDFETARNYSFRTIQSARNIDQMLFSGMAHFLARNPEMEFEVLEASKTAIWVTKDHQNHIGRSHSRLYHLVTD